MSTDGEHVGVRGYRVRGRVQGVGFRWWARGVAQDLGLGGTVKNLADGSVAGVSTVGVRGTTGRVAATDTDRTHDRGPRGFVTVDDRACKDRHGLMGRGKKRFEGEVREEP